MGTNALNKYTQYRKRPEVFKAVKWDPNDPLEDGVERGEDGIFYLNTPSGRSPISGDHYIVEDLRGSRYLVASRVWEATYEEIE